MAISTPNLERFSVELSYKLRDIVSGAQEDGELFSSEQRITYLSRAYASMKKKLASVKKDIETIFPDFFDITTLYFNEVSGEIQIVPDPVESATYPNLSDLQINLTGDIIAGKTVFKPIDLFAEVKLTTGNASFVTTRLDRINPENYFATLFNVNPYYTANDENLAYFWSTLNRKLRFAGGTAVIKSLQLFYPTPTEKFIINTSSDIVIQQEYAELFLSVAAYEAMLDLGDDKALNKAKMYNGEIMTQIKLEQYKEEVTDKRDSNRTVEK